MIIIYLYIAIAGGFLYAQYSLLQNTDATFAAINSCLFISILMLSAKIFQIYNDIAHISYAREIKQQKKKIREVLSWDEWDNINLNNFADNI